MEVNMNLDEMLQSMVNKDYDELVAFANTAISRLVTPLARMVGEDYASESLVKFIASCVTADGSLTPLEVKFISEIFGIEESAVYYFVKEVHDYEFADRFFDSLDENLRKHLLVLCCACFAVDEKINRDEIALLKRFLA